VRRPLPRQAVHAVVLAAAALLVGTGTALGQQVAGRLVSVDGTPVPWALVRLVDPSGENVATDITTSSGTYLLFAPGPGIYQVRTERIGFHSVLSGPLDLATGERHLLDLIASDAPIELAALDVRSSQGSCGLQPEEGSELLAIWNEVEKALELQTATAASGLYAFHLEVYEYVADRNGRPANQREAKEGTRELVLQGLSAFQAADPELLVERGFHWDNGAFYAPDAHTLLSDAFQRTHCYRPREKDGRLGVEFKPEATRGVIEVKGTLWLDESGKLSTLEYEYVSGNFSKPAMDGGYIEFEQLPEGAWIVRRWYIRARVEYNRLANYFLEAGGRIVEVEWVGSEESLVAQGLEQFSEQLEGLPPAPPLVLPGEIAAGLSPFRDPPDSAGVAGVLERNPNFASSSVGEAAAARAGLWRRAGQPSLALLELETSSPADPRRGLVEVERARILFAEGRSVEAAAAFRSACATGESLALEALWTDLRGLATSAEFAEWRTGPVESRCALLSEMVAERAWRAGLRVRDRLELHYERLELARDEWRLPEPRDRGGAVDQFGWRPELEFDDRGLLYVRMGRPDQVGRAIAGRDSTTGNWVDAWQYDRPERPRTFFFVSPMRAESGVTDYRLVAEPWRAATGEYASDQMDVVTDMAVEQAIGALTLGPHDEIYRQFGGLDPYTTPGTQRSLRIRSALVDAMTERREEVAADIAFAIDSVPDAPELHPSVRFGWEHLRFFDPASGNTTLWVLVAVLAGDLQPVVDENGWTNYRADVMVAARDGTTVSTDSVLTEVRLPGELAPESGLVAGVSISAPPGTHQFTVVVKDRNSVERPTGNWRRGTLTGLVPTGLPEISDIAVAADSGGAFNRDGATFLAVSPSHVTGPEGEVHVYFEVYGIPDGAPYTVELRVVPETLADRTWELAGGETTFGVSFASAMPALGGIGSHHLRLDLSDTPAGDYAIGIRITENETGTQSLPATTPVIRP